MVTLFKAEAELFKDIRWLEYGEIYDVEILEEGKLIEMELSSLEAGLLDLLHRGIREFQVIRVHNGQPVFAQVVGRSRYGIHFKRQYKF